MSLAEAVQELQKPSGYNALGGNVFHQHITNELLSGFHETETRDKKGKVSKKRVLDIRGKTEYPNVPTMALAHTLDSWLDEEFGKSASRDFVNYIDNFSIDMQSKDRKSRAEVVQILALNGMSQKVSTDTDVMKKLNEM